MLSNKFLSLHGRTISVAQKPKGVKHLVTETESRKQQELLFALERVSKVLTAEVDLQNILEGMATAVAKAVNAKWVNFWELTPDKKGLYIRAAYGMQPQYLDQSRNHPIPVGKAWIGRAVKTGRPWGTNDILTDPYLLRELGPTWKTAVKKQDYHGLLCVPTISRKGVVGGMCIYYPNPHEFTDFEMRLMTIAANQAATAITNAQIFGDLIAERNKTIAMLNSLADGLVVYDLHGVITAFNPKAEELLWINRKAVLGKNVHDLPHKRKQELKNLRELSLLPLHEFENREFFIEEPQRINLIITHLPVRDSENQKIGTMRVLHDITREKETEELKSNFISIASHQLRTPLSGIKWALALLQEETLQLLPPKHQKLIRKTYLANEQLIDLISDLLDTSRIEEGRFGYEFKKVNLVEAVKKTITQFDSLLEEKQEIQLIIEKPKSPLPLISADAKKLGMALYNVFDNAVKYTLKGVIRIAFYSTPSTLTLEVTDQGIGIPKDQQKFLFTKFFRARNAILLQTEGSGLGLWIANEIIKKHNGRIVLAESTEGKGTSFLLRFPIESKHIPRGRVKGL